MNVDFLDWGRINYEEALIKQKELLKKRQENLIPDTFVFCEHNAIITLGRGKPKPGELPYIPQDKIPVVNVERGGLATYHGPGQLVCYPFVKLSPPSKTQFPGGIVCFIRFLEDWMIRALAEFKVKGETISGKTGVWIPGQPARKVASVGIAVSHWVTYHGLAFNFGTGRDVWRGFNPCGLDGDIMTDLASEISSKTQDLSYKSLKDMFISTFATRFHILKQACQN